jgi:hypothetical protein
VALYEDKNNATFQKVLPQSLLSLPIIECPEDEEEEDDDIDEEDVHPAFRNRYLMQIKNTPHSHSSLSFSGQHTTKHSSSTKLLFWKGKSILYKSAINEVYPTTLSSSKKWSITTTYDSSTPNY